MEVTFHWKTFLLGVFFCFITLFTVTAQEESFSSTDDSFVADNNQQNINPQEIGLYFKDYFPVARMRNHSYNFLGGGINYAFYSPIIISPDKANEENRLGFSGRFDISGSFANEEYVKRWWTVNLFGGVFANFTINDWFAIQPKIEYGLQIDNVKSTRVANGAYFNQAFVFSPVFKFAPSNIKKNGLSIELSPSYTVGIEPDGIACYLGFRVGVMYRFRGSSSATSQKTQIEYVEVEKEVIKEVIKEVPVEKIVEKEVIKEVPVETIIEKEVIKEVPVEVIKYIEKEVIKEVYIDAPDPDDDISEDDEENYDESIENEESQDEIIIEEEPEEKIIPEVVKTVEVNLNEDGSVDINIPNLSFVSDKAILTDAPSNSETIQKVYEILSDSVYEGFICEITGYVNPDNLEWTEEEKGLAYERAESVSQKLINLGIAADKFVIKYGSGKTENKEYNRRVEFKLIK